MLRVSAACPGLFGSGGGDWAKQACSDSVVAASVPAWGSPWLRMAGWSPGGAASDFGIWLPPSPKPKSPEEGYFQRVGKFPYFLQFPLTLRASRHAPLLSTREGGAGALQC